MHFDLSNLFPAITHTPSKNNNFYLTSNLEDGDDFNGDTIMLNTSFKDRISNNSAHSNVEYKSFRERISNLLINSDNFEDLEESNELLDNEEEKIDCSVIQVICNLLFKNNFSDSFSKSTRFDLFPKTTILD